MERDCMLAHGAMSVILDRLLYQSDEFDCWICRRCGMIAECYAEDIRVCVRSPMFCRNCRLEGSENIAKVTIPYSFKLLSQEVAGLNICMRFRLEDAQD